MDDIERRATRMARVRILLAAGVGLASCIAILTGLLYLTTRDTFSDESWPEPGLVWLAIAGSVLGFAAMPWVFRADPGAGVRSWRSRLAALGWLVGVLLGFVIWSTMFALHTTGFGGPAYPWEMVIGGIGRAIRSTWAGWTGQSISEDLFPF